MTFSGQTAPCAVQVSGGTINGAANTTNFHSITTTTAVNTVNVSPLTDLVVANLVGTANPSAWFAGLSSPSSALAAITQANVDAALAKLVAAFPQLPLNTNNPLTMTFSATPGTVGDDMLSALQTAMTNSTTPYATLLADAAVPGFTAPAAGFGTALTTAYAGTSSGGSSAAPATPAGVGATASSTAQINVSWANVSGATSYNVYRSTSANVQLVAGNKVTSGTTTTGTPFANSGLSASTQYFYKVTAVNAAGESGGSTEVSATTQAVAAPAPTITSFTPGSGAAGSTVTITGTNLTAVTEVLFTGPSPSTAFASATIATHTATSISATVPASLAAGGYTISVIYPGHELAAAGTFTVTAGGGGTNAALVGTWKMMTQKDNTSTTVTDVSSFNIIEVLAANGDWTVTLPTAVVGITCQQSGTSTSTATTITTTTVTDSCSAPTTVGTVETDTYTIVGITLTADNGLTTYTYQKQVAAAPTLTSFTPASGAVGTSVTITGTNFSTTAASNTVSFNGVAATVTSATTTQLVVTVPAAATTGTISVTTAGGTATSAASFTVSVAGGGGATAYGSCTYPVQGYCIAYVGSFFIGSSNGGSVLSGNMQSSCPTPPYIWAASSNCSTANRVGACRNNVGSATETLSTYYTPNTVAAVQPTCISPSVWVP